MFILDILGIGGAVTDAIRTLALTLCETIYGCIYFCFNIFDSFGKARLEIDITGIFQRVEFILGLFMLFRLTFAAIEYLINPDDMIDRQKGIGNIIKKVLIVIVLLGSTRFLFSEAYKLQDRLIDSKIVEKIILPNFTFNKDENGNEYSHGATIAWYAFQQFYTLEETTNTCQSGHKEMLEETFLKHHKLDSAYICINEKDGDKYIIDFNGFVALVVGIVLLWMIIQYTIQVGIRVIKLAYLEIIAPIPIMMYLMPKGEEKITKWAQQCLTTFLDFFIRLAIIDLVILVSASLISEESQFVNYFDTNGIWEDGYIVVIMILALFAFAKKVPDLLKEIFPSIGGGAGLSFDFGLKSLKSVATFGTGAAVGAVGGAATGIKYGKGTAGGRLGGALTGLARGTVGGAKTKGNILANAGKGISSQRAAMQRAYNRNNDGSSFWGRTFGAGNAARAKADFDQELSLYDAYEQNTKIIDAELEKNAIVQSAMAKKQALMERTQTGGIAPTASEIREADALIKQAKKTALQVEIGRGPTGKLKAALDNAEAIREKGITSKYSGFGKVSISTGTAKDRADAYFDNKDSAQGETRNIKDPAGARNKEYKEAEANAKYARDK